MKLLSLSIRRRQQPLTSPLLLINLIFFTLTLVLSFGCKKSDSAPPPTNPTVTTTALTNVTTSSATTGGTIVSNGNAAITQSGIVWSKTNTTPGLTDSVIAGITSSGSFTTNLTGLDFNTVYYIRAYATNSVGTGYGDVVKLNTANDTSKVRFTYDGKEVIYGIIISPTTGKKWLDRNLGAMQVATAFDDYKAYGDLFQWGRPADGHQLINWTSSTAGTGVNGTTTVLATSDVPGHNNLIVSDVVFDWRSDNNRNRWITLHQGPCPAGWHVPNHNEWAAEIPEASGGTATTGGIINRVTAFSLLKLTSAGYRTGNTDDDPAGTIRRQVTFGRYHSSSDYISPGDPIVYTDILSFGSAYANISQTVKTWGLCVRCVMN